MYLTYVALITDNSASMRTLVDVAADDFNASIERLQAAAARDKDADYLVSVIQCGVGREAAVERLVVNRPVDRIRPFKRGEYVADGVSTPLFDAVGAAIETLSAMPNADDPTVAFLVLVTTDGEENSSKVWKNPKTKDASRLISEIARLQATDRWTFAFRVPERGRGVLRSMGIPKENIRSWEQTEEGLADAMAAQTSALDVYTQQRSAGLTASKAFYTTDMTNASLAEIKTKLEVVSHEVKFFSVDDASLPIKEFGEEKVKFYKPGDWFYSLVKPEAIQEAKLLCVRHKSTGNVYAGRGVRKLLGLPSGATIKVKPAAHGDYEIFVQSYSNNRRLQLNQSVMYWPRHRIM